MYNYLLYFSIIITGVIALLKIEIPKGSIPFKKQKRKWLIFILACLSVIIPSVITVLDYTNKGKIESVESKTGNIQTFQNLNGIMAIGQRDCDTSLVAKFSNFNDPYKEFGFAEENRTMLKTYLSGKKLILDAIIRDANGNVLAAITNGFWKNYCDTCEYNNDNDAFELITRDGDVIFQIDYNNNILFFAGFLGFNNGGGIYCKPVFKNGQVEKSILIGVDRNSDYSKFGNDIPTIFLYPREKYLGQRREK